jgi:uncharacterized protein (TIRG00374 family)
MTRFKWSHILKIIFFLAIAGLLLYFSFRGIPLNKVMEELLKANIFWVALSGFLSIVALVSRAYRWKLLIETLGYSPSLKNSLYSLMVGYFANLAFPRLGELTRCGSLSKVETIPVGGLLGTVVIERMIDVLSLLICLLLAAVIEYQRLSHFFRDQLINPMTSKIEYLLNSTVGIMVLLFIVVVIIFLFFFLKKRSSSWVAKVLRDFVDGLRSITKLKKGWQFLFHSVFIWLLYYLAVYVCFFAIAPTRELGPGAALFLLVAGGIAMSAPVQGGIGAYHLLVSQGLVLYGLSRQDGLIFATLVHTLQLLIVVVLGTVSLFALFISNRKAQSAAEPVILP